jgi:phosphate transport system substrate-binding protein
VNDEFLHRLREQPPPAFAAQLRARLEAQAVARRFRTRQISLYALIACLLGGTAWALVSPGVRTSTTEVIRRLLPDAVVKAIDSYAPAASSGEDTRSRQPHLPRGSQSQSAGEVSGRAAAPLNRVVAADADTAKVGSGSSFLTESSRVVTPTRASTQLAGPAVIDVEIEGAKVTASVISLALKPFAARQSQAQQQRVRAELRASSTERAFQKLCAGEIDVALATRPMLPAEVAVCRRANVVFTELPIAYEALVVVVNGANDWAQALSLRELGTLFDPASQGFTIGWNELQPKWPTATIVLAAPRPGQGFQESFAELVLGGASGNRSDIRVERDEVALMQFVQRFISGLTYLPFASYLRSDSLDSLKLVQIVNSRGVAVTPSRASIADGSYEPLSRPLLAYVRSGISDYQAASQFVRFFLQTADTLVSNSRYLPLERSEYQLADKVLRKNLTAAIADTADTESITVRKLLLQYFSGPDRERERAELDRAMRR